MQETAELSDSAPVCANCGAPLTGEYCQVCGERRLRPDEHTLRHIVGDWFEAFSHGEGRLLNSLRILLLKPGELTREYFRGRRVPYTRPVALFFAINLLYFLLNTSNTFTTPLKVQLSIRPLVETKQTVVLEQVLGARASVAERAEVMDDYRRLQRALTAEVVLGQTPNAAGVQKDIAASRHPPELAALHRYEQRFDEQSGTLSRALIIVLVPMMSCFLWLMLAPLRRGLPELVIFSTHLWSGLLLLLMLSAWLLLAALRISQWFSAGRIPPIFQSDGFSSAAIGVVVMVYVYCALRRSFRFPRIGCAALSAWVFAGLYLSLEVYRVLLFFVTVHVLEH